ncbi:hypothetical protein ACFZDG_22215 [Kitasatospora xanthocidica]|uniref:hypothetical protein n=1 Tax=Kitasatospora xanthocidica TaxID=83382 RepID=UPI0036F03AEA
MSPKVSGHILERLRARDMEYVLVTRATAATGLLGQSEDDAAGDRTARDPGGRAGNERSARP